jgi:hypothetical protein
VIRCFYIAVNTYPIRGQQFKLDEEVLPGRLPLTPQAMLALAFEDFMIRCISGIITTILDSDLLTHDLDGNSGSDSDGGLSDDDAEGSATGLLTIGDGQKEGSPMNTSDDDEMKADDTGSPMNTIDDDVKEDMTYSICRVILKHIEIDVEMEIAAKRQKQRLFQVRVTYMCTVCCTYVYTFNFITVS